MSVLWVDAPQPMRSMHARDRDAREGWEDLLPCIRSTNLLQVFLAVLPGHACSPLQEAPPLCVHTVCDRGTERRRERKGACLFLSFRGICREIITSTRWPQVIKNPNRRQTHILMTYVYQSYHSLDHRKQRMDCLKASVTIFIHIYVYV